MKTLNIAQLEVEELSNQEMIETQGGSFLDFVNMTEIFDLGHTATALSIGGSDD